MRYLSLLAVVLLMTGCNKKEGPGGQATITGRIFVREYNESFTQQTDAYYAMEERVYIMYGDDDEVYDDDTRTNFDGTFEFKWLERGNYTIFVYSDDSTFTIPGGEAPIFVDVEINDKKEVVDVGEITIIKGN